MCPSNKGLVQFWMPILNIHILPFAMLAPVSIYFYYRSIEIGKIYWQKSNLIHLVPAILLAINFIPYFLLPFEQKTSFYEHLISDSSGNQTMNLYLFLQDKFARLIPLTMDFLYFLFFIWEYAISPKNDNLKEKKKNKFIRHSLAIYIINWLPNISLSFGAALLNLGNTKLEHAFKNQYVPDTIMLSILATILPLTFLLFPSFTYKFQFEFLKSSILYTHFKKSDTKKIPDANHFPEDLDTIINYVKTEKPYLKHNFNLNDLSNSIGISQTHISYLLKIHLNISFPKFKNQCRVFHAMKLLNENQQKQYSIEGVAALAGFKNKSTFYAAFKHEMGKTPIEWLQNKI
jgi:AraC-like DNA-binding protein